MEVVVNNRGLLFPVDHCTLNIIERHKKILLRMSELIKIFSLKLRRIICISTNIYSEKRKTARRCICAIFYSTLKISNQVPRMMGNIKIANLTAKNSINLYFNKITPCDTNPYKGIIIQKSEPILFCYL